MLHEKACHGLIRQYVNFHTNQTIIINILFVKIRRWGKSEKEKKPQIYFIAKSVNHISDLIKCLDRHSKDSKANPACNLLVFRSYVSK